MLRDEIFNSLPNKLLYHCEILILYTWNIKVFGILTVLWWTHNSTATGYFKSALRSSSSLSHYPSENAVITMGSGAGASGCLDCISRVGICVGPITISLDAFYFSVNYLAMLNTCQRQPQSWWCKRCLRPQTSAKQLHVVFNIWLKLKFGLVSLSVAV